MKKIAIVILNWNGAELLSTFLPSVLRYSKEATVYVADNASTDTSVQLLKTKFPTVTILQNKQNFGFAKGYNLALKTVKEPYLCLLNNDVEVTENWLQPVLELFQNELDTAIIQPKILDYKNKSYFEYAGAAGGFIDKYGFPFCRGRIFTSLEKDVAQYNDVIDIFWASGACFFIRNTVFQQINGFDDDFFAHQEEIDVCWRVHHYNYKVKYCGASTVYHLGGATLQVGSPKKTYLNFRNSLFMLVKNLPKNKMIPTIFIRLVLDGLAGIQFVLKKKPLHTWAIVKAHFALYAKIGHFLKKRTTITYKKYYKVNSVVYLYFIRKKYTFLQIINTNLGNK